MDPSETSCADFGKLILSKKAQIFDAWLQEARAIFGGELEQSLLENKIAILLNVVAEALGATPPSIESAEEKAARAEEHGILRAEQGFSAEQVSREFQMLRRAIRETCTQAGMPLTPKATNIIAEVIDTAAIIGVGRLSERREELIKKDDARKMSFIVHDFRAPLGAIALASSEIIDTMPPSAKTPEMMESLAMVQRNVERLSVEMERTMRELANVFSGAGLRITKVRLHDAVDEVLDQLKASARVNNVILSNRIDAVIEVSAAPDALHRILMNLVSNALRYTWDGEVSIDGKPKETEIEVAVSDTGRGIMTEKLAHIFEPGEKEPDSPGMGFGLAIAKYLVELQGGRIRIESPVDRGTRAIFTLPLAPR